MVLDTTMDSMYLENLDEFLNDEGKIVTYKWLSLSLGVHCNVAKQMLYHFVTKERDADKGDGLNVSYMVSGVMSGDDKQDVHKMVLVREENLAAVKSKMKDVISIHIYSVQKTKLKDMSVLYTANYDKVKEKLISINKYSGIECKAAKVRSSADIEKIHQQNAYQAPFEPAPVQKKSTKPVPEKVVPKKDPASEESMDKQANSNKQAGKPNQIASMFARQSVKSEVKKGDKKVVKQETSKSKKSPGISAFFGKAPAAKTPVTPDSVSPIKSESIDSPTTSDSSRYPASKSEPTSSPVKTESLLSSVKSESQDSTVGTESQDSTVKTESQDSSALESQTDKMEVDDSPPKKTKAKKQSKIKPNKAAQKRGKNKRSDDECPIPKRKRIMQLSDSESSSGEENEVEEEAPFPESPIPEHTRIESDEEEEVIPSTPQPAPKEQLLSKNGRPKKRKLVAKTFMDEDGFFVTKKEYDYVSDSGEENEENIPAQKNIEENVPAQKNISSPKKTESKSPQKKKAVGKSPSKKSSKDVNKTKQSSIMSFFGKK